MNQLPEILRLRVLLCFINEDENDCTVMEISRILGQEHYTISRIIASLEKEGYLYRKSPRRPALTDYGRQEAERYHERISVSMSHLLYEGVTMENAKNDAYYWALYNTDETMEVIKSAEEQYRVKYELRNQHTFSGNMLCEKLRDGEYKFPFIIYREQVKNGSNISMANDGFEHPCTLVVRDGTGYFQVRAVEISANSKATGLKMRGRVTKLKYFDSGRYISAEKSGEIITIPAGVFEFRNMGDGMGQILHGMVCLRMQCSVGPVHMPESTAFFTVLI